MTNPKTQNPEPHSQQTRKKPNRKRRCLIAIGVVVLLIVLFFLIILILALTIYKPKQPRTTLTSATIRGIAPRVSFPSIDIKLNITLDLEILVENRNRVTFLHEAGTSLLEYQDKQVGDAVLSPGKLPAMGSATIPCRLTLQVDEVTSDIGALFRDVVAGELVLETRTRIPGKVKLFGIISKKIVAISDCRLTIGFPSMQLKEQDCESKAKI